MNCRAKPFVAVAERVIAPVEKSGVLRSSVVGVLHPTLIISTFSVIIADWRFLGDHSSLEKTTNREPSKPKTIMLASILYLRIIDIFFVSAIRMY